MPKNSRYTDEERTIVDLKVGAALPSGHRLQEFVIEGVLGLGGFGIVYRARDTRLQRNVALKEYMPSALAARSADYSVTALSDWQRETFATGLRSFVNEAQLLASFDHPSLVKVHRFWEENGTAYMVMPLYKGVTLKRWLRQSGTQPDQAWLLALLMPLIDALEQLHNADPCCLHRDVAPDNVLLLESARGDASSPDALRPLLLDFGAARRVIGDMTRTLTVFLKPGYAPIEQYGDSITSRQGPWTDVYALSAVLYACITGHAPVASVDRVLHDDMVPAAEAGAGRYTPGFLAAIDAGLSVRPEGRPASMAEFRRCFVADVPVLSPLADGIGLGSTPSEAASKSTQALLGKPAAAAAYDATRVVPPRIIHRGRWAVAAVSLAVIAALGWWAVRPVATVPPPLAGGTIDTGTKGGQTTTHPAETAGATQMPSGGAVSAPSAPPFGVLAALQDIVERADASIRVGASVDKLTLVIGKDPMRFRVKSSEPGYVYVFSGGTDKQHFNLLFPNRLDKAHRIEANTELALPRPSWQIVASGPPGTNHLVVLVSRHERNLSHVGLRQTDEPIREFDLVQAERLWKAKADGPNPFVGEPVCAPTVACSAAYGATMLVVDETAAPARK